jgi:hypothetical protein
MNTTDTRDPADIEAEIRRTQEDMSRTVGRIGDQFTPRNIINGLLDKAETMTSTPPADRRCAAQSSGSCPALCRSDLAGQRL